MQMLILTIFICLITFSTQAKELVILKWDDCNYSLDNDLLHKACIGRVIRNNFGSIKAKVDLNQTYKEVTKGLVELALITKGGAAARVARFGFNKVKFEDTKGTKIAFKKLNKEFHYLFSDFGSLSPSEKAKFMTNPEIEHAFRLLSPKNKIMALRNMGVDQNKISAKILDQIEQNDADIEKIEQEIKNGNYENKEILDKLQNQYSQLTNSFNNQFATEILLQVSNSKYLPENIKKSVLNSLEKINNSKDKKGNIIDQQLYDEGLEEANDAKMAIDLFNNREIIKIGGMSFEHITDETMHNFTKGIGIAYYTIQTLQHLGQLSSDPKLQKVLNDSMNITHNLVVAYNSFSELAGGLTGVAAAGAVSAGVGAVVGIITMFASSGNKKSQQKAFQAIFKQLQSLLDLTHKVYELQVESYNDIQFIKFQNEVIKNRIIDVQKFLVKLHHNQFIIHEDLRNQLDKLENKISQSSDEIEFTSFDNTVSEVFKKFEKFLNKYLDLTDEKEEAITLNEFNGEYQEELIEKIINYQDFLPKKVDQVVSFLLVNEYEIDPSLTSRLRFNDLNTLFKLSLSHLDDERNSAGNKHKINLNYSAPDQLGNNKLDLPYLYKVRTEHFFDHLHTMYTNTLNDSSIKRTADSITFTYQDVTDESKVKTHKVFNEDIFVLKRSNYLLFNILSKLYSEVQKFKFKGKKISENALNIIKDRINESIELQKAYRSILPVALNRFTNLINSFSQKIDISDENNSDKLIPLAK